MVKNQENLVPEFREYWGKKGGRRETSERDGGFATTPYQRDLMAGITLLRRQGGPSGKAE